MKPPSFASSSAKSSDDLSHSVPKDWKFWCIIFSLAMSTLLIAIEFVSRPFVIATLHGKAVKWNV